MQDTSHREHDHDIQLEPIPEMTPAIDQELDAVERLNCPECGGPVTSADVRVPVLVCPACGAQFFRPAASGPQATEEPHQLDYGAAARQGPMEAELNGSRIRQLSALRRGAYRSRSYCIVAASVLIVAAVKLATMTVRYLRHAGWQTRPIGYVFAIIAAAIGAGFFLHRIVELNRELRRPSLPEPTAPPDFSTLSDGSQHWKNLEEM
jgi:hypothetical protein